jgi:hypothetical protein
MSEKVIEKTNWPLWIVTTFVIALLISMGMLALDMSGRFFACAFQLSILSVRPFCTPIAWLIAIMFSAIPKYIGKKLNMTTLAYVFIITYMTSSITYSFPFSPETYVSGVWKSTPAIRDAMSKLWWVPPEAAVAPIWGAGGSVDWVAWSPALLFTFLNNFIALIIGSALVCIFRRQWIDIEKVPYPNVTATWGIVEFIHLGRARWKMPFLIGFIIGFAFFLQQMLTLLFPWWPDVLGLKILNVGTQGCINITPGSGLWPIANQLVGFMKGNLQLASYAFALLIPLDILFSAWFLWVVFMILAQVAYVMGYYTGALDYSGCCRALIGPWERSPVWGPPLNWGWMCMTGGMFAFILVMLWYAKAYLVEAAMAALGRPSPKIKEMEAREPISYRMAFIQLIIGCVLFIAFLASQQVDFVLGAITFIFLGFIYPLANTYSVGLTGVYYCKERSKWSMWPVHLIWSRHPETYTPGWCAAGLLLVRGSNDPGLMVYPWPAVTLASFKIADLAGIHPRTLYKMILVAFPIIQVTSSVFWLWACHQFTAFVRIPLWDYENEFFGKNLYNTVPPANELIVPIASGFIITIVLYVLRMRFIWWPIHPLGFLLSGAAWVVWMGTWMCFLVAWFAKWLLLKIGGSRAYTEYGVPFVCGIVAGYALVTVIGMLAGLVMVVRPF